MKSAAVFLILSFAVVIVMSSPQESPESQEEGGHPILILASSSLFLRPNEVHLLILDNLLPALLRIVMHKQWVTREIVMHASNASIMLFVPNYLFSRQIDSTA